MFKSNTYTRIATIAAALMLGACASSGPKYVAADDAGDYGHYSTKLDDNRFRITFNGNERTGLDTTKDYALLRAAELTLQEGYTWFEVVDRETRTTEVERDFPRSGIAHERGHMVERNCGLLGCSERVRPRTTTSIHIDTAGEKSSYSYSMEVLMGNGEMPQKGGNYYNASSVAKSLWAGM